MLQQHAPLIAVTAVLCILLYLVFRDLKSLRVDLNALAALTAAPSPPAVVSKPETAAQAKASDPPPPPSPPPTQPVKSKAK
jgi:hypothetical protein